MSQVKPRIGDTLASIVEQTTKQLAVFDARPSPGLLYLINSIPGLLAELEIELSDTHTHAIRQVRAEMYKAKQGMRKVERQLRRASKDAQNVRPTD